jgi:hypothetical protein
MTALENKGFLMAIDTGIDLMADATVRSSSISSMI